MISCSRGNTLVESRDRQIGIEDEVEDRRECLCKAVLDAFSETGTEKHQEGESGSGELSDERHRKSRQEAQTARDLENADQGAELGNAVAHILPLHLRPKKARQTETEEGNRGETDQGRVHWEQFRADAASRIR